MLIQNLKRQPRLLLAPPEKGAAAVAEPIDDDQAALDELEAEKAALEAEEAAAAEALAAEEAEAAEEAARLTKSDEDRAAEEAEAQRIAEEAEAAKAEAAKPKALTDEEFQAEAQARGFVPKPAEKSQETVASDDPPEIPDFRTQAYDEAYRYKSLVEEVDGEIVLNSKGVAWAENKALDLATEHRLEKTQAQAAIQTLQASRPRIEEDTVVHIQTVTKGKIDEAQAKEIAKSYTDIVMGYGVDAYYDVLNAQAPDSPEKAAKFKHAELLRNTAYRVALGMAYEKQLLASAEGGEEGDSAREPVATKTTGGLYDGLSKRDIEYLQNDWAKQVNGGKPPTRAQIEQLKKDEIIG